MKWIKHDSDAHMDAKIRRLILKWGVEGYGLYWYCLELIAKDVSAKNLTFELEHDAEIIAHDMRMSREKTEEMMRSMVDLGLFENVEGRITCLKLFHRVDLSQGGSSAFRKAITAKREVLGKQNNHDTVMTQSAISHDSVSNQSCLDVDVDVDVDLEVRCKNNKGRFTPPTLEQVTDYCHSRGNSIDPNNFIDHYQANGWMRGKNKIKDWKACVRTWEKSQPEQAQEHIL